MGTAVVVVVVYHLLLVITYFLAAGGATDPETECEPPCDVNQLDRFNRQEFDADFIFGASSSAYQYEGAANEGRKGQSNWDAFTHKYPGKIMNGSNGDVAIDFYHRYKDDVAIMKKMGLDAFKFSISWSRLLPTGKLSGGVNKEGIRFYNDLIDELLKTGIKPFVTLFHFELPQALECEYQGFLDSQIRDDFRDFADLCFWEFGDRVKHWITLNGPELYTNLGYAKGTMPPGRHENSGTEPYKVARNLLLAHANVVKRYRDHYQPFQKGKIGITLSSGWFEPYDQDKDEDKEAKKRALAFEIGWFLQPLSNGTYPEIMSKTVGSRPELEFLFNQDEKKSVSRSFDFLGLNYYGASFVKAASKHDDAPQNQRTLDSDKNFERTATKSKGEKYTPEISAKGLEKLLGHIKNTYDVPEIYVTENGYGTPNDPSETLLQARKDTMRTDHLKKHLCYLKKATRSINEGNNDHKKTTKASGYFVWSLLDNFEWASGYTTRYGIIYVDYQNGLARYPKESALWYSKFLSSTAQTGRAGPDNPMIIKISGRDFCQY